jgi:hypothetical protein
VDSGQYAHARLHAKILPCELGQEEDFHQLPRSNLTPELTGREESKQAFNLADESRAISAPVE